MRIEKMDLKTAKLDIVQKLLHVSDGSLIERIAKILEKEMIVGYTVDGIRLTKKDFDQRLQKAEEQFKTGKLTGQDDLEKEVDNW